MKKKIVALGLCVVLALSATACGKDDKKKASSGNVGKENTSTSTEKEDKPENHVANMSGTEYKGKVVLPDYKSLTIAESLVKVDEEILKKVDLNVLMAEIADFKNVKKNEGTIKEYDVVNIDYVGKINGATFEGGSAEGYNLGIGSGTFIDGFEEGLVGVETGKTVDLSLKFPDDYQSSDLAGKEVVFTVTVNYILEMTDGFVKDNQDLLRYFLYRYFSKAETVETVAEFRKVVEDGLRVQNIISYSFEKIAEEAEITADETELSNYIKEQSESYREAAEAYGYTFEEYLKNFTYFQTEKELLEYITQVHENMVLMMALAREEGVVATEDDYKAVADSMVFISAGEYEDIASFEVDYPKQTTVDDIIYGNVYYKIADYIKVVPDAEAIIKPEEKETTAE